MKRRRVVPVALLALVLAVGGPAGWGHARERAARGTLSARIEARVDAGRLRAGTVGVCVVALDTGQVVYARDAGTALVPASVSKVATAAAALDLLGPGWRYVTTLTARGPLDPATGVLDGDLVLHGSGDPNLSKRGHEDEPLYPLGRLAKAAADAGVRSVSGALVLDDGPFDREYVHASWTSGDLQSWYGAPVAGLSFNDSCVTVRVRGGASEGSPTVVELPCSSGPWPVANVAATTDVRRSNVGAVWVDDRARLRVAGEVPPRTATDFDVPVPDPLAYAGGAMLGALERAGVRVPRFRAAASREDRAPGRVLGRVEHDLATTLRVMNRKSQNFYASLVFKACGAAREGVGSWASGERAVADAFARRGISDPGLRIVDGSGLARENRLTAGALARILTSFDGDLLRGPILRESLAIPGDDGTLHKRLADASARARVRAKTGTLRGVHALAGYVDGKDGGRGHAFALVLNRDPADGPATDLIDDVVREILDE